MNEEFPVSASHKLALITSLPFVHTARRYYRLDGLVRSSDWTRRGGQPSGRGSEKKIKLDHLEEVKVVTRFRWVNLRKDHYRIDRRVVVSATAAGNDSRSSLERARRQTLCIPTAAGLRAAPPKSPPPGRRAPAPAAPAGEGAEAAPARRRRTGRARADGERRRHLACRRRRTRSPVRGSKSRSSSSRPPRTGLARVLPLRRRDGRPPGRRFSVTSLFVTHSVIGTFL